MTRRFDGTPETVRVVRHFVRATLAAWDMDDLREVASLLSTELASNAVRHVGAGYQLALELEPPELRIEVLDPSSNLPVRGTVPLDSESGKGLMLVDALAVRWGARRTRQGKAVWFALSAGRPAPLLA